MWGCPGGAAPPLRGGAAPEGRPPRSAERSGGAGVHLNTNAFGPEGAQLLIEALNTNFGLVCKMHSRNRIYIPSKSMPKFKAIVQPAPLGAAPPSGGRLMFLKDFNTN